MRTTMIVAVSLAFFSFVILAVVSGTRHYMPENAEAKYTVADFSALAKSITTKDECLSALGEPDERHVHSGAGGVIVGEQWVYLKLVLDDGLRRDANFFWNADTGKLDRVRLFNMDSDSNPIE